ncbi:MAG: hypothetical protein U9N79_02480 [Actinomycetota bacterium]|nr:hypothetical protein [Actinomycetota bacterium]
MALLDAFKQQVLNLGRSEARAKARPLLVDDEAFDRSAAGLDQRMSEAFVLFWLLSDRALYLVAGGTVGDWVFRIPYACIEEMVLEFDEDSEMLPWNVRLRLGPDGTGEITTFDDIPDPGKPLAAPPARVVESDERDRLTNGEIIPLAGFALLGRKFRSTLARQLAANGARLHIHGEDRAEAQRKLRARKR